MKYILILSFVFVAGAYKISSNCIDVCNLRSSIKCQESCTLDESSISALRTIYNDDVLNTCVTPCRCDKNQYEYLDNSVCKVLQSFAFENAGNDCQCNQNVWVNNILKWNIHEPRDYIDKNIIELLIKEEDSKKSMTRVASTVESILSSWNNWCREQCTNGLGGKACKCDIMP